MHRINKPGRRNVVHAALATILCGWQFSLYEKSLRRYNCAGPLARRYTDILMVYYGQRQVMNSGVATHNQRLES